MGFMVNQYYRSASSATAKKEDGTAVNHSRQFYFCWDGVSGPYSPSNPGLDYGDGLTGGQWISQELERAVNQTAGNHPEWDLVGLLCCVNRSIRLRHIDTGLDPAKNAVAGACLAASQLTSDELVVILIGDCFILWYDEDGAHFRTNFDKAAYDFEDKGNRVFEEAKWLAAKKGTKPWDEYYPYFCDKQYKRANRNIGSGGHAMLNGDPAVEQCWTQLRIPRRGLKRVLQGSDGLLHSSFRPDQSAQLAAVYRQGGIVDVVSWRDEKDYLPHIGLGQHPEGSAIELIFADH